MMRSRFWITLLFAFSLIVAGALFSPQGVLADEPVPLPRDCNGVTPPDPPDCCMFGYVYAEDVPVAGAAVRVASPYGILTATTAVGGFSTIPYYQVDLSAPPLSATVGTQITVTATTDEAAGSRAWTLVNRGQQVDLGVHPLTLPFAGWQDVGATSATEGGISDNDGSSSAASIAVAPDGTVYVAWADHSSLNGEVYVKKWDGHVWQEVGAGSASGGGISNNSGTVGHLRVTVAPDGVPYVAWIDNTAGPGQVYARRFLSGTWQEIGVGSASGGGVSNTSCNSDTWGDMIAIAPDGAPGGVPYLVWKDDCGWPEIYAKRFVDGSWQWVGPNGLVSHNTSAQYSSSPAIAIAPGGVPGGVPYVVWHEGGWGSNRYNIYARRFIDGTWQDVGTGSASGDGIISASADASIYPQIAVAPDGAPYVTWIEQVSGVKNIFLRRWNGATWEEVGTGSASGGGISGSGSAGNADVAVAPACGEQSRTNGTPYVTWHDSGSGDYEIHVRRWNGDTWEEVGTGSASGGGISDNAGDSTGPAIAIAPDGVPGGMPYVAWNDDSSGDWEIYARRWGSDGAARHYLNHFTDLAGWILGEGLMATRCDEPLLQSDSVIYTTGASRAGYVALPQPVVPEATETLTIAMRFRYDGQGAIFVGLMKNADFTCETYQNDGVVLALGSEGNDAYILNLTPGGTEDLRVPTTYDGAWHVAQLVRDAEGYWRLYIDGVFQGTGRHQDFDFGYRYLSVQTYGATTLGEIDYISVSAAGRSTVPAAAFSAAPLTGTLPLEVAFTDQSAGVLSTWTWNFGDPFALPGTGGGVSGARYPSHVYESRDTFTVTLNVSGPYGADTLTRTHMITTYAPARADFVASPTHGVRPLTVVFTDTSVGDVDTWHWDFGDGPGGVSVMQNPTHTYTHAGVYTVTLTVTGPAGADVEQKTNYIAALSNGVSWTFALYFAGDNDLHLHLMHAIERLEEVDNPHVDVVVLWDGWREGDTRLYHVEHHPSDGIGSPVIAVPWNTGERNAGDPQTLIDFVAWARATYPADHTLLSIADHGRGTTGVAWDDTSGGDYLSAYAELGSALQTITADGSERIAVLLFDACLMAMIEDAYEVADYVDYVVASENLSWSVFAYEAYVAGVTGSTIPRHLARNIAGAYFAALHDRPATISVLDMAAIPDVGRAVDNLAAGLNAYLDAATVSQMKDIRDVVQTFDSRDYQVLDSDDEYVDLYHLAQLVASDLAAPAVQSAAQGVMDAVDTCVVAAYHQSGVDPWSGNTWDLDNAHGLSLYFPPQEGGWDYQAYVAGGSWAFTQATAWAQFLVSYFDLIALPPPPPPVDPHHPLVLPITKPQVFLPVVLRGN